MTSGPRVRNTTPKATMASERPRLKLCVRKKPKVPDPGYVDGAWWPRSRDLSAELPALLAVLAARLGPIARLSYQLTEWDPRARQVNPNGTLARLGGRRCQHQDTADVTTSAGYHITLVIVPPESEGDDARLIMASRRNNNERREGVPSLRGMAGIGAGPLPHALPAPLIRNDAP